MMNYTQSDYAVNKNAGGIVYRFVDGIIEISLEDYLRENPDKTAADFAALKTLSDSDYLDTDRSDYRQTWKNTPLETLLEDESATLSAPSVEDEYVDREANEAVYAKQKSTARLAMGKLTETQHRRYLMHHVEGLTTRQIAKKERTSNIAVFYSLEAAEKKIKKVLGND